MINLIRKKIESLDNNEQKFNYLREYLQILILSILDEAGYFRNIAFIGGTALRIVYGINRYSEDLDFSLFNKEKYNFDLLVDKLVRELSLRNLDISIKKKKAKSAVQSVFIRFGGVLFETGLSPLQDEKLAIKFEVDSNPPLGFKLAYHSFNEPMLFNLCCFDMPSLMAGKLHAIFQRKYEKGRDYYDLWWYLLSETVPNLELLNNSLEQTTGSNPGITLSNWKEKLLEKIKTTDFSIVHKDLSTFLISKSELKNLSLENFTRVLGK